MIPGPSGSRFAAGGVAGPIVFIGAWVGGSIVAGGGYSFIDDAISRLAATGSSTRPLMTCGFVGFGLGVGAFAAALRRSLRGPAWIAALGAAGSTILVAAAPLDHSTLVDRFHAAFAGAGYLALAATPLLAARHLVADGRVALARSGVVAGIVSAASLVVSLSPAPTGLFQRIGLTATDLWIIAIGVVLITARSTSTGATS